jgi:hypothetical protein
MLGELWGRQQRTTIRESSQNFAAAYLIRREKSCETQKVFVSAKYGVSCVAQAGNYK